jgi:predicted DsbA family dithiol-disulfide isomerase
MKINVYSTMTCPYCIVLKHWLDVLILAKRPYRRLAKISGSFGDYSNIS